VRVAAAPRSGSFIDVKKWQHVFWFWVLRSNAKIGKEKRTGWILSKKKKKLSLL